MKTTAQRCRISQLQPVSTAILVGALFPLFVAAGGCSKQEEAPRVMTLEGKISDLVLNADGSGELTVLYHSEKRNLDVLGTALITPETEVLIDGVIATAKEIRIGERIRGDVRVDKKGNKKTQTVVKIYVDRPKTEG